MKFLTIMLATTTMLLAGCGRDEKAGTEPAPPVPMPVPEQIEETAPAEERSTTQTVVEGVTGAQVIRKGEEIKDTLRNISEDRQKQLEELEDF